MDRQRQIRRRPRLIVGLLLAFCIDTLRPAVHPAAHHHAGGELPHMHVGDVATERGAGRSLLFGADLTPPPAPARGRRAFTASPQVDLHVHLLRPLHVAHVAPLAPVPTIERHLIARANVYEGERAASTRPGQARSPPRIPA
ncbi:MAG: hypothetical protein HY271_18580 [Deltaproteobacteria bacterium]|nr:hypothetical protein [Deltaproteobacteria bacterium]